VPLAIHAKKAKNTMRLYISCFMLVVGLIGCGPPGPCGYLGCEEGTVCTSNGCEACGGEGQLCCNGHYGEFCTEAGFGCEPGDGPGHCSFDCGAPGKPCCEDAGGWGICDGEASCAFDMCPGTVASDPCSEGSTFYTFWLITADCAAVSIEFKTNSLAEAQQCLADTVTAGPGEELCDANVPFTSSHVCESDESMGWTFQHCSAAQLAACEANACGEASCTWGACP